MSATRAHRPAGLGTPGEREAGGTHRFMRVLQMNRQESWLSSHLSVNGTCLQNTSSNSANYIYQKLKRSGCY